MRFVVWEPFLQLLSFRLSKSSPSLSIPIILLKSPIQGLGRTLEISTTSSTFSERGAKAHVYAKNKSPAITQCSSSRHGKTLCRPFSDYHGTLVFISHILPTTQCPPILTQVLSFLDAPMLGRVETVATLFCRSTCLDVLLIHV